MNRNVSAQYPISSNSMPTKPASATRRTPPSSNEDFVTANPGISNTHIYETRTSALNTIAQAQDGKRNLHSPSRRVPWVRGRQLEQPSRARPCTLVPRTWYAYGFCSSTVCRIRQAEAGWHRVVCDGSPRCHQRILGPGSPCTEPGTSDRRSRRLRTW